MRKFNKFNSIELKRFAQLFSDSFIHSEITDFFNDLGYQLPRTESTKWRFAKDWLEQIQKQIDGPNQIVNIMVNFCKSSYHIKDNQALSNIIDEINKSFKSQNILIDETGQLVEYRKEILEKNLVKKAQIQTNENDAGHKKIQILISYSHDSPDHKKWVLNFAKKIQRPEIQVILDQWSLKDGNDLPKFAEKFVSESDYVLVICTPEYKEKADKRTGGAGMETIIITSEIYNQDIDRFGKPAKFIPVLRNGNIESSIPKYLQTKKYRDFTTDEYINQDFEQFIQDLLESNIELIENKSPSTSYTEIQENLPQEELNFLFEIFKQTHHQIKRITTQITWNSVGYSVKENHINKLSLHQIGLKSLPSSIKDIKFLQELYLHANLLHNLPKELFELEFLKVFDCSYNSINLIPDEIQNLKSIIKIDMRKNIITIIPDAIYNWKDVKFIDLAENHIKLIPETIGALKQLEELYLESNEIQIIPRSIIELKKITKFVILNRNPINLNDIKDRSILNWLKELSSRDSLH